MHPVSRNRVRLRPASQPPHGRGPPPPWGREWELQAEQLRHAAAEKDRKAAQLENACADLREEALQHQKV